MKLSRKPIKPRYVSVEFYDHFRSSGDNIDPCVCKLVGTLYMEDEIHHYIASWVAEGQLDGPDADVYGIVKSCIISMKSL